MARSRHPIFLDIQESAPSTLEALEMKQVASSTPDSMSDDSYSVAMQAHSAYDSSDPSDSCVKTDVG